MSLSKMSPEQAYEAFLKTGNFDARASLRRPGKSANVELEDSQNAAFNAKLRVLVLLDKLPDGESHVCVQTLEAKLSKNRSPLVNFLKMLMNITNWHTYIKDKEKKYYF